MSHDHSRPALFLDRDGVINVEVQYLRNPAQVRLLRGTAGAIAEFNLKKILVVIVTNQAGIGRGLLSLGDYEAVQRRLMSKLARGGAYIDATYYCPHHPEHGKGALRRICHCRKPAPGLLLRAAEELEIDLGRSVMVGDNRSDLEAGRAAGCHTMLVRTGYGREVEAELFAEGRFDLFDHIANSLKDGVPWLLGTMGCQR